MLDIYNKIEFHSNGLLEIEPPTLRALPDTTASELPPSVSLQNPLFFILSTALDLFL